MNEYEWGSGLTNFIILIKFKFKCEFDMRMRRLAGQ
jgi:hypothetical protein